MSALARWLLSQGYPVSGSDLTDSPTLQDLKERGAQVHTSHRATQIQYANWVVLSDAIHPDNPEVIEAQRLNLPLWRRSQLLGWLLKDYKVIAITGTHGKTTTTAMIAQVLDEAGLDPVVLIGGDIPNKQPPWQHNLRLGEGEWAVVEACEAYESYLDLQPAIAVITNVEPDHLDYHGSLENIELSFAQFLRQVKPGGRRILCGDSSSCHSICEQIQSEGSDRACYFYGVASSNDLSLRILEQHSRGTRFEVKSARETQTYTLSSQAAGEHNALNALAAIAVAQFIGIDQTPLQSALEHFVGVKRRLEVIGDVAGCAIIDDYAHHPTEIAASINALKQRYPNRRLITIFQPHLYSRTRDQLAGFIDSLHSSDVVIITDIYPAREEPIPGISAALIAEGLLANGHSSTHYVPVKELIPALLMKIAEPGDVIIAMGAGNIDWVARETIQRLETRANASRRRVAVLIGGNSSEREVSLLSGARVIQALNPKKYDAFIVDPAQLKHGEGLLDLFSDPKPEVAFIALHGGYGENGALQGLLELAGIPHTGSSVLASALAMNKHACKIVLQSAGLQTPKGLLVKRDLPYSMEEIQNRLSLPLIVKPNEGGSTLGVTRVEDWETLPRAIVRALTYDEGALIEECIEGMEISVPIIGNRQPRALPAVEIVPMSGFYDFQAKYEPGATKEIVPARLNDTLTERAQQTALKAHSLIGCRGMSRVDMIVRGEELFILEINTVPGLTETSLLPLSAQAAGIAFEELIEKLIDWALE